MTQAPDILLEEGFLTDPAALFAALVDGVDWDTRMKARETASFGEPYDYSQISYPAVPMLDVLLPVQERLRRRLGVEFNNCLLNHYRTGRSTMGFHADDTSELAPGTGVAIVSLGSARDITYRSQADPEVLCRFSLQPGSLLYMDDRVQADWMHAVKKQGGVGPRISLTWRQLRLTTE